MYILQEQRSVDLTQAFQRYREFLRENKEEFPESVLKIATSTWYFDPSNHKCPHDAWLENFTIEEPAEGNRHEMRRVIIRITLLAPYHDGHIQFFYDGVSKYSLEGADVEGHCDWMYDEFRLSDQGNVVHEIEWAGVSQSARWIIEPKQIFYSWHDK